MKRQNEFYTAKEKLGLLSFGDPGTSEKIQLGDTYLISVARKIDNKIKAHPELKKKLVRARSGVRKIKQKVGSAHSTIPRIHRDDSKIVTQSVAVSSIVLPSHKKPAVSIIIPAFNKREMTESCLISLSKLDDRVSFEVILVDNASSDTTKDLEQISGLVYVANDTNLGFVGGCNSGIPHAKGDYVIFLNNDTEVDQDWLYHLYTTITNESTVGLVGSKIVYPNGLLQEAGGIIFKNGDGLNYGKYDQADAFQYNYVRDVDYCSGASIIISKQLLQRFGGFDKLYHPAYYEDTDLSFKVRQAGLRVVYQPLSLIYHIEGGTAGTNLNSGFKKYQVINREKFLERWDKDLSTTHKDADEYYLGRDRSGDKLALIIEESVPTPDKDSGSVRMVAMIKGLQELGYKVTFWPNGLEKKQPYTRQLQQSGVEVVYGDVDFLQFAKHYAHFYDVVIMSRPEICARYINVCKSLFTKAKFIYDTVDLHYVRLSRQAEIEQANAEALLEQSRWYRVLELGLMERVDSTLVVSEKEVGILREEGVDAKIEVVSNIHSVHPEAYKVGFKSRKDIIFVGNYAHLPNRDALKWFMNEILPLLRKGMKDIQLIVVGANMPKDLEKSALSTSNVSLKGYVSDSELSQLLTNSRLFVAPLRYGAGVKGKIGQAIEYGAPVVTTAIGMEGMFLKDGISCSVANTPQEFCDKIIDLYSSQEKWVKIRDAARTTIDAHFSLEAAKEGLKRATY